MGRDCKRDQGQIMTGVTPTQYFENIPRIYLCRWIDNEVACVGSGTREEARQRAEEMRPGVEIAFLD